jgi:hypothetical protein
MLFVPYHIIPIYGKSELLAFTANDYNQFQIMNPLLTRRKVPQPLLDSVGWPQSWSAHKGEDRNVMPCWNKPLSTGFPHAA